MSFARRGPIAKMFQILQSAELDALMLRWQERTWAQHWLSIWIRSVITESREGEVGCLLFWYYFGGGCLLRR